MKFTFSSKRWYFIVVTHSYRIIRRSEVSLYVDGELVSALPLQYPRLSSSLDQCMVGALPKANVGRTQSFRGQLGKLYLFQDVLSKSAVSSLYKLGENMKSSFGADGSLVTGQRKQNFLLNNKKTIKIHFALDPRAVNGRQAIDTSSGLSVNMGRGTEGVKTQNVERPKTTKKGCAINPEHNPKLSLIPYLRP